jgi:3'-5' exoribonuclease
VQRELIFRVRTVRYLSAGVRICNAVDQNRDWTRLQPPSGPRRTVRDTVFVRQMQDGCEVDCVLLVRQAERRGGREGSEYLQLVLGDRTGSVPAVVWEGVPEVLRVVRPGQPVRVTGRYGGEPRQLVIDTLRVPAPGTWRDEDLDDGPPRTAPQMEADLRALVATVHEPHLSALLARFFGEGSETWARYRAAPAAKHFHQAYRHGLLEHSLTVAQGVGAVSAIFPGIDRDVAVTGALLHDIGKLEAYASSDARIDLTDAGRLQGEISLGYYTVRKAIEEIDGFPPRLTEALLHIILAHHGSLEHGSPVVPCTREATLVHFIDNLGGRLGSFDRLEKSLGSGEHWSGWDRALGGTAYFAGPGEDAAAEAAA